MRHPLVLVLLSGCAWEVPLSPDPEAATNGIQGTVVVNATEVTGPVFVLLYDAADPPPPEGTGRPVNFDAIPASAFSGDGTGVVSAPFALTDVPDGTFLVTALADQDGDFNPLVSIAGGSTCGDMVGAHLADLVTGDIGAVTVAGGELQSDVTVAVAQDMTLERPAFVFANNGVTRYDPTLGEEAEDDTFTLSSTAVHADLIDSVSGEQVPFIELTGPFDGTDLCDTAFLLYVPDADGDGLPDPHPNEAFAAAGLPEVWPRVYLQYVGDEAAEGETWASEAIYDPEALIYGLYYAAAYGDTDNVLEVNTPYFLTEADFVFTGAAQRTGADGSSEVVYGDDVLAGDWGATVVSRTGQTWTVPNALADAETFPTTDATTYQPAAQAARLTVE